MTPDLCTHCRRQLVAGANFCSHCGAPAAPPGVLPSIAPEVRQGTVVNCDLVDYTGLTVRLDLEDSRRVVRAALSAIAGVMSQFKDSVFLSADRTEGDSVMYVFGYPHARDDDPVRATKAAMKAAAAVAALRPVPGVTPQIRVGVATGEVVIEPHVDGVGRTAHGNACNLAARLRELAAPGEVIMSQETRKLVAGYVRCEDLGLRELKGFGVRRAWRIEGIRRVASSFVALRGHSGLTPLIGRGKEIGTLMDRWQLARDGLGQVVFLSGDPGVGKSRLLTEVVNRTGVDDSAVQRYQCEPYRRTSAFHPIVESMLNSLDVSDDTSAQEKRSRLDAILKGVLALSDKIADVVAGVLSIDTRTHSGSPETTRRDALEESEALVAVAQASLTRGQASIVVLEDAQWADPSTLRVLRAITARIAAWPALLIITHRPEFEDPIESDDHVARLDLGGLDQAQCETLVRRIDTRGAIPKEIVRHIVQRADGVPLFVEELTRAILEQMEQLGPMHEEALVEAVLKLSVPMALRDHLTARLDRAPAGKQVAQVASIIGREFSGSLLSTVMRGSAVRVSEGLTELQSSGLVHARHADTDTTYVFKHALIQDVARDSLLRSTRQALHERVARTLERQVGMGRSVSPEVLARHFSEAGLPGTAVGYWELAGNEAARRSANAEAIHHFYRGLECADTMEDTVLRTGTRMRLLTALSRVVVAATGYVSDEVTRVFQVAQTLLADLPEEHTGKFVVTWTQAQSHIVAARYGDALEIGIRLARDAARTGHDENLAYSEMLIGLAHLYCGEFVLAREHLEHCIAIMRREDLRPETAQSKADSIAPALAYLARTLWFLGLPDQAMQRAHEALATVADASIPSLSTQTASMMMLLHQIRNEPSRTREWIDRTLADAKEKRNPYWQSLATIVERWWNACHDGVTARRDVRDAIDHYRDQQWGVGLTSFLLLESEALERSGKVDEAEAAVEAALEFAGQSREEYYLAEVHRRRATLLAARGEHRGAEVAFHSALAVAARQQALGWQLRCTTSYAQWLVDEGRESEAAARLSPVVADLTEGLDLPDAVAARALLARLPGPQLDSGRTSSTSRTSSSV